MSRTEELQKKGVRRIGGSSYPFVKWGNDYAFVEGRVDDYWEGEFGPVIRIHVENVSDGLLGQVDRNAPKEAVKVGDDVHVGLAYATLGGVRREHVGAKLHIAFVEWVAMRGGKQFRDFTVYELEAAPEGAHDEPAPVADDDIPFSFVLPFLMTSILTGAAHAQGLLQVFGA